jgi:cytoskeletal protein RodZ
MVPVLGGGVIAAWATAGPCLIPAHAHPDEYRWRRSVSIGETLADARRQAGLTVSDVSQRTRIRESIIRDIEQGNFTSSGGDFYARGHIRSIAGAVGTDPAPLISEYDAEHGPLHPMRAADVFEPSRPVKIRERRSPSLALIVIVVLLGIIGFSAYHLISKHNKDSGHLAAGTSTPTARPTVHHTPKPTTSPKPSATPSDDVVISVAAGPEPCWVLLTRASDGSQLFMGDVQAGSSMTWTENQSVYIRLGNPGAITLTVNGKKYPINTVFPITLSFSPQSGSTSGATST